MSLIFNVLRRREIRSPFQLSDEQRSQYREDGYAVLESVIPATVLTKLEQSCRKVVTNVDTRDSTAVEGEEPIESRAGYFEPVHPNQDASVAEFSSCPLCAGVVRGTLGPTAYLFLAQYTVKAPGTDLTFEWHQDAAYLPHSSSHTINIWCALDDMTEENGTLYFMPNSQVGVDTEQPGADSGDIAAKLEDQVGTPFLAPAGSIVVFSSSVFHRSGPNTTSQMRRALTLEFSEEPLLDHETQQPLMWAVPVLRSGATV